MRQEHHRLLSLLRKLGSPALISDLRDGFDVNDRTLRRWLLALCDEGQVEATGTNKGRRYRIAESQVENPRIEDETLDGLQEALLREAIHDAACGQTLAILLSERIRALLPTPTRRGFIGNTLERLETMTPEEAESLGISPMVFKYWHRLQSSPENPPS